MAMSRPVIPPLRARPATYTFESIVEGWTSYDGSLSKHTEALLRMHQISPTSPRYLEFVHRSTLLWMNTENAVGGIPSAPAVSAVPVAPAAAAVVVDVPATPAVSAEPGSPAFSVVNESPPYSYVDLMEVFFNDSP